MIRLIRTLIRETRGAATVEFAFLTVFFFGVVMAALDVGMYFIQQSRLTEAVSSASISAFASRNAVTFTNIPTIVSSGAGAPSGTTVSVSTVCNGTPATACTNSNRTCACLSQTGTYTTATCGATCTGNGMSSGATAGYYMTINASYTYRPVVLPHGLLTGKTVSRSLTERLQ